MPKTMARMLISTFVFVRTGTMPPKTRAAYVSLEIS